MPLMLGPGVRYEYQKIFEAVIDTDTDVGLFR